ncbi:MAG: protoporphyrinogen oxidase [Micrococcales bacterium]|nr:protoporphyrinogen oxidase [Micrococcales bacterium]
MTGKGSATGGDAVANKSATSAVVVGAGIGGLTVARALARAGIETLVLDGRDAPGGSVRSHQVAGLTLDAGAESFATRGGHVAALLDDMGLGERITTPNPVGAWVQLPDVARPMPRGGVLGVPGRPCSSGIRRTLGLAGAARAWLDLILPARVGAGGSLREQVERRMGRRVVERLVHPVVGGVYGADPSDVTLAALAPHLAAELPRARGSLARAVRAVDTGLPAGSAVQGLSGGLHLLTSALVDDVVAHGGKVQVRSKVTGVARDGDGWTVTVTGTQGTAGPTTTGHRADLLVLASPALTGLPGLDEVELDEGRPSTLVTLVVDDARLDAAPRGTGVLVAPGCTQVKAKALTHSTVKWPWLAEQAGPGRHVLRVSYEGNTLGEWTDANRAARRDAALVDASRLLDLELAPDSVVGFDVVVWTQAMPRPSAAHREAVATVKNLAETTPGLWVTGSWVAGTGLAAVASDARAVAEAIIAEHA